MEAEQLTLDLNAGLFALLNDQLRLERECGCGQTVFWIDAGQPEDYQALRHLGHIDLLLGSDAQPLTRLLFSKANEFLMLVSLMQINGRQQALGYSLWHVKAGQAAQPNECAWQLAALHICHCDNVPRASTAHEQQDLLAASKSSGFASVIIPDQTLIADLPPYRLVPTGHHHLLAFMHAVRASMADITIYEAWCKRDFGLRDALEHVDLAVRGRQAGLALFCSLINERQQLLAEVSLHSWTSDKSARIGYWVHSDFCGQGLATRGVAGMLDFARQQLPLEAVEFVIRHDHPASCRVAEKLGARLTDNRRLAIDYYGKQIPAVQYIWTP